MDPIELLITQEAQSQYTLAVESNQDFLQPLAAADVDALFPRGHTDYQMARCCQSGLWLLYNFLEQSHEISQSISTPAGSYWHAIMHRLEGDYSNSKYWLRQAGDELLDVVAAAVVADASPALIDGQNFHAVDLVNRVQQFGAAKNHAWAVAEWNALFGYCFEQATQSVRTGDQ